MCGKILFKTESMTDPVDPTSGIILEAFAGLEMGVEGGFGVHWQGFESHGEKILVGRMLILLLGWFVVKL